MNFRSSTRNARIIFIVLLIVAALYACLSTVTANMVPHIFTAHAQAGTDGQWTASIASNKQGQLEINFTVLSGPYNTMGNSMPLSDFSGISESDVRSTTRTNVNFTLVREPGTIKCSGSFENGRGSGTWTFEADARFAAAMKERGFSVTDDQMLRAAFHRLTVRYVDDMRNAGFEKEGFDDISRAAGHDISIAYVNELRSAGYPGMTLEDLIRAHNHDINGSYIAGVRDLGFGKEPMDELIRLKNHEIDRDFVEKIRSAGLEDVSIDDLIRLRNHDVTPQFITEVRSQGFSIDAEAAIRLKNSGADVDMIRRAKAQYPSASVEDVIHLIRKGSVK